MLFGEYEAVEEFLAFLCKACYCSFSFAHRIVWFLKAMLSPTNIYNDKIKNILHLIQTIFKSESKKMLLERLHVAGSKGFIEYLSKHNYLILYGQTPEQYDNSGTGTEGGGQIKSKQISQLTKIQETRDILNSLYDRDYNNEVAKHEQGNTDNKPIQTITEVTEGQIPNIQQLENIKLKNEDIFFNIFKRYDSVTNDEDNINSQHLKQIDIDDINLSSFLSGIHFFDHLCNICEQVAFSPIPNQHKILLGELRKVNKMLPSNTYLPFLKDSIRNYVIVHIPLSEVRIFKTKNRSPYMLTIEVLRLEEVTFNLSEEEKSKRKSSMESGSSSGGNKSSSDEEEKELSPEGKKEKKKKSSPIKKNKVAQSTNSARNEFKRHRSQSFVDSLLSTHNKQENQQNDVNLMVNPKKDPENKDQSFTNRKSTEQKPQKGTLLNRSHIKTFAEPIEKKGSNNFRVSKLEEDFLRMKKHNFLLESDVNISKPLMIKNIYSSSKQGADGRTSKATAPRKSPKKKFKYEGVDLEVDPETDPEDLDKIENVVKHQISGTNRSTLVNEKINTSDENKLPFESEAIIKLQRDTQNTNKSLDEDDIIKFKHPMITEELKTSENNNQNTTVNIDDRTNRDLISHINTEGGIGKLKKKNSNSPEKEVKNSSKSPKKKASKLMKEEDVVTDSNNRNESNIKIKIEDIPNTSIDNLDDSYDNDNIVLTPSSKLGHEAIFGEKLEEQTERLRGLSPFGNFSTFKIFKMIVKSGEDLRQEQFATQLINEFMQIFKMEKVECWVHTYEIIATGNNCGIIEVVPNAVSIDQLKRKAKDITSLRNFYESYYGPTTSKRYKTAIKNFIQSLAGYSLVCYFLQIKDRHNANILIDDQGHIVHIDFGFMLSNAPGKGIKFEKAPFKLTKEFVDVMGGVNSKYFNKFRKLLWK
jgi:hypothetical protein